ncbi:MAG: DUF547 domain-containing protein [Halieaceae bacterium]|jgi:hypothetical protein|nr:DUF547 domain-containing protein [Halieaceae bacterium]
MSDWVTLAGDLWAPYLSAGRLDYDRLAADVDTQAWVRWIAHADLDRAGRDEQLAFYLNAYNLLVIHQAVRRLRRRSDWPGVLTFGDKLRFFGLERHRVAGRAINLYTLENSIIRRRFREPRIHFALNCASSSCPPLPERLFVAETLDADLERLTRRFLESDAVAYNAATHTLTVSRIFRWYRKDFQPSVPAYIARYRDVPTDVRVVYQRYDWSLNRA